MDVVWILLLVSTATTLTLAQGTELIMTYVKYFYWLKLTLFSSNGSFPREQAAVIIE